LSLITSYQYANPGAGKLVYCTRTVPEMNAVMEELGVVLAYRAKELNQSMYNHNNEGNKNQGINENKTRRNGAGDGSFSTDIEDIGSYGILNNDGPNNIVSSNNSNQPATMTSDTSNNPNTANKNRRNKRTYKRKQPSNSNLGPISNNGLGAGGSGALALCLSSRRNMCIHERVLHESDREAVDAACRSMTASWVIEKATQQPGSIETCSYYDTFRDAGEATSLPSGIYDLEELKKWGESKTWCPYYLTRQAINHASILVFNYQYMVRINSD
jgi:Rad3-related DNA helicase